MVGAKGFEPSTSCSQSRCATRLRHAPKKNPRRCGAGKLWGERWDLNPRPPGPQPGALPTELLPPRKGSYTQLLFLWQALFLQMSLWILSRKQPILFLAPRHRALPNLDHKPTNASGGGMRGTAVIRRQTGPHNGRQTFFGDIHDHAPAIA